MSFRTRAPWTFIARALIVCSLSAIPAARAQGDPPDLAYQIADRGGPGDDTVFVIDTARLTVVGEATVGNGSEFIAASPDGSRVYVSTAFRGNNIDTIEVIDTSRLEVVDRLFPDVARLGRFAFDPGGALLYVSVLNPSLVLVIDTATNEIIDTISLGEDSAFPLGIAVTPDGKTIYVAPFLPGARSQITVIDATAREMVAAVPMPSCSGFPLSTDIAITPDGSRLYVPVFGCTGSSGSSAGAQSCAGDCDGNGRTTGTEITQVVLIVGGAVDPSTCPAADSDGSGRVTGTDVTRAVVALGQGRCPGDLTVPESGNFSLVVDTETNTVIDIIDFGSAGSGGATETGLAAGAAVSGTGVEITPDGKRAYVAGCGEGFCVIDTERNVVSATVPASLTFEVAITGDGTSAFIVDIGSDELLVVDTATNEVTDALSFSFPGSVAIGAAPGP